MSRYIEVWNAASVMGDDEEAMKKLKSKSRNGKEVHRCNRFTMIPQKGLPLLNRRWLPWRFAYPVQHSSLGDIEAKHFQLTMNARRAPSPILRDHNSTTRSRVVYISVEPLSVFESRGMYTRYRDESPAQS